MDELTIKNIGKFTAELHRMSEAIYLACDAEVAADVCLKTRKAVRLIRALSEENEALRLAANGRRPDGSLAPSDPVRQSN
ncbi:MAG: hypothetical protein KAT58_09755 [candidate division Zixibacteria bacterium]|nr:hypothetical protein [candidate division Zixibacteria bacterium]